MAQGREEEGKEGESIVTRRDGTHVTLTQPGQRPFRRRLTLLSTQRRKPVQGLDAGSLKQQGMERGSQIALVQALHLRGSGLTSPTVFSSRVTPSSALPARPIPSVAAGSSAQTKPSLSPGNPSRLRDGDSLFNSAPSCPAHDANFHPPPRPRRRSEG